jgi:hypothetical protein
MAYEQASQAHATATDHDTPSTDLSLLRDLIIHLEQTTANDNVVQALLQFISERQALLQAQRNEALAALETLYAQVESIQQDAFAEGLMAADIPGAEPGGLAWLLAHLDPADAIAIGTIRQAAQLLHEALYVAHVTRNDITCASDVMPDDSDLDWGSNDHP